MHDHQRLISARLTGEPLPWDAGSDERTIDDFVEQSTYHGVLCLLDARFRFERDGCTWPERIAAACRRAHAAQLGYEHLHRAEMRRVLAALAEESVQSLLLKGTGLAYGLYASPSLRPRADTDLLVAPAMRKVAVRTLQALGYDRITGPAGDFVGYQMQLKRRDTLGVVHDIDLHWRISNAQTFAWLFSFSELAASAVPVASLDARALRLGNAHALMLCLLHRAGNNVFMERGFGDRLIWLYDIHLLVAAMPPAELDEFRAATESKRVGAIVLDGLRRCAECFPSPRLEALIEALAASPRAASGADILRDGRLRREWIELFAIPKSRIRLAYLAERVFPSRQYMRERYPESPAIALPRLHVQRWLEGVGKLVSSRRRAG